MARTFIRPSTQIQKSDVYDDTLDLSTAETAAVTIEDDLNFIRSKLKAVHGAADWFSPIQGSFNLQAVHDKTFTFWIQKNDNTAVPAGQNFVALSGSSKPSDVAAFGATTLGAITAQIPAADIGAHSLAAAANTANLCEVRDAATNDVIYTATNVQIYALLQVGQSAIDGAAFADSGSAQGQLSFVYMDPNTDAFVAVPVADIAGRTIEYAFRKRTNFANLPENAFDPGVTFTDSFSMAEIDLQMVYNNDSDGQFDLALNKNFTVNLNGNANVEFKDGATSYLKTNRTGSSVDFGVDASLTAGKKLKFYDADGSNFVGFSAPALITDSNYLLPDADGVANTVWATNGSGAISWKYVGDILNTKKATYVPASNIPANTSIALSSFTNPDTMAFGAVATTWVNNFDVYVNGQLQMSGVNQAAATDVYYVSNTQLAFNFLIKKDDIVTVVQRR